IKTMDKNYDAFMKMNLSPYLGEWVAVCENKIVAHGKKVKDNCMGCIIFVRNYLIVNCAYQRVVSYAIYDKDVFYEAKDRCPGKRSFMAMVPGKEAWIFGGDN
ncbi:MAG: hypothetical protein AABY26_01775, partial [Nanoarchaeota archaeon]